MNSPGLHPVDDYLLHGRAGPELEARLREDPKAREALVAGAALDSALSHYFSVIEPSMRARSPRFRPAPLRIAALLVLGLGVGLAALVWRSVKDLPLPALAAAPRAPAPVAVEAPPAAAPVAAAARITGARGGVTWIGRAGEARVGDEIRAGEGLAVAADAICEVQLPEGSRLRLFDGSAARFAGGRHDEVVLTRGMLAARVKPRPADAPLHLRTVQARIIVRGTEFQMTATPQETRIQVTEGRVEVIAAHTERQLILGAGDRATARGTIVYRSGDGRITWYLRPATWE